MAENKTLSRENAYALLAEYTQSPSLLKHAQTVEAAMLWYAKHFDQSAEDSLLWGITGLLHDFDYEKYPEPVSPNGHPFMGCSILEESGYPEAMRRAILGHAQYSGVPRDTLMAKVLFAVDELCGLTIASALVRPDKSLANLEPRSILKKMKDKAFARGCNRDDIRQGAEELGIALEDHVANVLKALQESGIQAA
jgi:predicted hydrolase (HD superfamily)